MLARLSQRGLKNSYINCFVKLAKHLDRYFAYANPNYKLQLQDFTYFKEKRGLEDIEILTFEEMQRIADTPLSDNTEAASRYYILVRLLMFTGCRISEACNLKTKDVQTDRICFRDTKNTDDRWVYIPTELSTELLNIASLEYVFSTNGINPLHDRIANDTIKQKAKKAGVTKRVYSHLFRHSFITNMILAGAPMAMVAQIVGHRDISVTNQYYIHLNHKDQELTMLTYHQLLKEQQPFELVKSRTKEVIEKMIDKGSVCINLSETDTKLVIELSIA